MTPQEIKDLRNTLGLSQAKFGKGLGLSKQVIESWEMGNRAPSASSIALLSHLAECRSFQRKVIKKSKS